MYLRLTNWIWTLNISCLFACNFVFEILLHAYKTELMLASLDGILVPLVQLIHANATRKVRFLEVHEVAFVSVLAMPSLLELLAHLLVKSFVLEFASHAIGTTLRS